MTLKLIYDISVIITLLLMFVYRLLLFSLACNSLFESEIEQEQGSKKEFLLQLIWCFIPIAHYVLIWAFIIDIIHIINAIKEDL